MLFNCGVGEDSWESLRLQGDPTSPFYRRSALGVHWKDWCWSWKETPTLWPLVWITNSLEKTLILGKIEAGGEGDNRGWDRGMASLTQWTWVWVSSGSYWWTGKPGVLQSMGSQRIGHDWATELNWTEVEEGKQAEQLLCMILQCYFLLDRSHRTHNIKGEPPYKLSVLGADDMSM